MKVFFVIIPSGESLGSMDWTPALGPLPSNGQMIFIPATTEHEGPWLVTSVLRDFRKAPSEVEIGLMSLKDIEPKAEAPL